MKRLLALACCFFLMNVVQADTFTITGNPIITDRWTADPAALVVGDTVYLYVGHDEAGEGEMFNIREWLLYSSQDMQTWTYHGPVLRPTDFEWAVRDAWASQVVENHGRFWFYVTVQHDHPHYGKAIGVAVADTPYVSSNRSRLFSFYFPIALPFLGEKR